MECAFADFGRSVFRHRYLTVLLVFALMVVLLLRLPSLTVDTSNDAFYHPNDPIRVQYNDFQQQFGKDDRIVIAIEADEIFSASVLRQIDALQQDIEQRVPHLKTSTSLLTVRYTSSIDDELLVEDFIETIPDDPTQLAALKARAESNEFYPRLPVIGDGRYTFIDIEPVAARLLEDGSQQFISTVEYKEMMLAIEPIIEAYQSETFGLHVAGFPVITDRLTRAIEQTLADHTADDPDQPGIPVFTVPPLLRGCLPDADRGHVDCCCGWHHDPGYRSRSTWSPRLFQPCCRWWQSLTRCIYCRLFTVNTTKTVVTRKPPLPMPWVVTDSRY